MKPVVYALGGAVFATALVLACSDDSPSDADAAVCDCPAAEPPVPSRVMTIVGASVTTPPNGIGGGGAMCPAGAKFLSGGCVVDEPTVDDIQLHHFGKVDGQEAMFCTWLSHHPAAQMVHAEVTCLVP